jgi:cellulose synthase/poly-beta-1,6-N-acetylglucosamine synthase-like glycosyltransferase
VDNLLRPFRDKKVGAVAGNAKVGNRQNALTRCQALEYVTGQNLERRSYDLLNCISVVPGAVSAWRRELVLAAGGFSAETLAEDADLTFHVHRLGYKVVYSADAVGYTEAPETVGGFLKQRVRWMYGTLQTVWKHRDITFRPRYGALGFYTIPSIYIFQMFFPLFSVVVELLMLSTLGWHLWQLGHHPTGEVAAVNSLAALGLFYLLFLSIEVAMSLVAFLLEPNEDKGLLVWVLVQRFFYRPLLSLVAIRTAVLIVTGRPTGWNKVERTASVRLPRSVLAAAGGRHDSAALRESPPRGAPPRTRVVPAR